MLPRLQFLEGQGRESLGAPVSRKSSSVEGIPAMMRSTSCGANRSCENYGRRADKTFEALARIDTPVEAEYYRNGGILPYVLRQLV